MKLLLITFLTVFRVAFVGDPQVDNEMELQYARRSVYSELRQRGDLDLVVILGDLVNEKSELIKPSEESLDSLGCPWVRVNGNHDPVLPRKDTCFNFGAVHFVLLDNVRITRKAYEGGLNESQKRWLDSLVRVIPEREKIVVCTHIPLSECKGRDSLANILAPRREVLAVCGHTHYVQRHILERGVEEVLAGASCGSWWRGVKDSRGIPCALMNCGAPRGYFIADFKSCPSCRKWYTLSYKAVDGDVPASAFYRDGRLIVNVFGGSKEGKVEAVCKGRRILLNHSYEIAPEVLDIIWANSQTSREYRKAHRGEFIPLRRLPSPHIWAADLDAPPSDEVKVIYRDPSMRFRTSLRVKKDI